MASQVAETVVNGRAVADRMGLLSACTYILRVYVCAHAAHVCPSYSSNLMRPGVNADLTCFNS